MIVFIHIFVVSLHGAVRYDEDAAFLDFLFFMQDKPDGKNRSTQHQPSSTPGTEKHISVTTLSLLLAMVVVMAIVLIGLQQSSPASNDQAPGLSDNNGSVSYVQSRIVEATDSRTEGLITENTTIVQSRSAEIGSRSWRIIVFDTLPDQQNLASRYRGWLADNNYEISDSNTATSSGSLVASREEEEVILVYSENGEGGSFRTQLTFITPKPN